jgi:CheY-like chemotaxis protein
MKEVNNAPITILAIDDETEVLARIASVLEAAGYQCRCAADAHEAEEIVRQVTPELIISDINLVGHSGLTICEQLKQQAGIDEVPVMFLSAAQVPSIIRRSYAAGGVYYLRKPFDASVLVQIIEKVRLSAPARPATPPAVAPSRPMSATELPKPAGPRIVAIRTNSALAVK